MNEKLAAMIDHTALKPDTKKKQIEKLCEEAEKYQFASVCVNPCWVRTASEFLNASNVKVCTVVGFPLGASTVETKVFETKNAITNGAREIDMVINIGALKSGDHETVLYDIEAVVEAAGDILTKVIIETALLSEDEKKIACELAVKAGADFVKTSTGFASGGAKVEDIALMRKVVGPNLGVKASGGVKDRKAADAMVEAGATRIGASSGVEIVQD